MIIKSTAIEATIDNGYHGNFLANLHIYDEDYLVLNLTTNNKNRFFMKY